MLSLVIIPLLSELLNLLKDKLFNTINSINLVLPVKQYNSLLGDINIYLYNLYCFFTLFIFF
jgi:hypothetical protein